MTKKKNKAKPLPPGEYTCRMVKFRKIRNKPWYRVVYETPLGDRFEDRLPYMPEKDDLKC